MRRNLDGSQLETLIEAARSEAEREDPTRTSESPKPNRHRLFQGLQSAVVGCDCRSVTPLTPYDGEFIIDTAGRSGTRFARQLCP